MYKAQVLDKIANGKGYEVLRNKVISHISEVETHIKNVTGEDFVFSESETVSYTHLLPLAVGMALVASQTVQFLYGEAFSPTALTIQLMCPLRCVSETGEGYSTVYHLWKICRRECYGHFKGYA